MPFDHLAAHTAFQATDMDQVAAAVESCLAARMTQGPRQLDGVPAVANRCSLAQSTLWFCSYGSPLSLRFGDNDDIRVQFHVQGAGRTRMRSTAVEIRPDQSCISYGETEIDFGASYKQLVWRVPKRSLVRKLALLTGAPVRDLQFDTTLNLEQPAGLVLRQMAFGMVRMVDAAKDGLSEALLVEMEEVALTSLLRLGRDLAGAAIRCEPAVASWQARRAIDYIEAHWAGPITIEDLVTVSGCSMRSLFRTFKQSKGCTPLDYVRHCRLQHANRLLQNSGEGATVTEIALRCGFGDLSRFSKDYLAAYGETPSAVLKRHRTLQ